MSVVVMLPYPLPLVPMPVYRVRLTFLSAAFKRKKGLLFRDNQGYSDQGPAWNSGPAA